MKFLLGFNVDSCYVVGGWLVESLLGGDEQILLVRGHLPPSPPVWKTLEVTSVTMKEPFHLHNFITKKLSLKLLMYINLEEKNCSFKLFSNDFLNV